MLTLARSYTFLNGDLLLRESHTEEGIKNLGELTDNRYKVEPNKLALGCFGRNVLWGKAAFGKCEACMVLTGAESLCDGCG